MSHVFSRAIAWNGINWPFLKFEDNTISESKLVRALVLLHVSVLVILYRLPRRSLQTRIVMRDTVDVGKGERDYTSIFYRTYCIIFEIYCYFFVSAQNGQGVPRQDSGLFANNGKSEAATLKNLLHSQKKNSWFAFIAEDAFNPAR